MGKEAEKILEEMNNDGIQLRPNAKIPFIPGGITYKLKRALKKAGCNAFVTAGQKLSSILCGKNKSKSDRLQGKGIYKYNCVPCRKSYIGETSRSFKLRHSEHMKAAEGGRWSHSGLTQHMEKCDGDIQGPEILCRVNSNGKTSKNCLKYDLRIKEALYIRRYDCGPFKGMNEDIGSYVKTTQWDPVFATMKGQRVGTGVQGNIPS